MLTSKRSFCLAASVFLGVVALFFGVRAWATGTLQVKADATSTPPKNAVIAFDHEKNVIFRGQAIAYNVRIMDPAGKHMKIRQEIWLVAKHEPNSKRVLVSSQFMSPGQRATHFSFECNLEDGNYLIKVMFSGRKVAAAAVFTVKTATAVDAKAKALGTAKGKPGAAKVLQTDPIVLTPLTGAEVVNFGQMPVAPQNSFKITPKLDPTWPPIPTVDLRMDKRVYLYMYLNFASPYTSEPADDGHGNPVDHSVTVELDRKVTVQPPVWTCVIRYSNAGNIPVGATECNFPSDGSFYTATDTLGIGRPGNDLPNGCYRLLIRRNTKDSDHPGVPGEWSCAPFMVITQDNPTPPSCDFASDTCGSPENCTVTVP